jgi:hypothetical protein
MAVPHKTIGILGTDVVAEQCVRPAREIFTVDGDDLNHLATLSYRLVHGPALDIEEYSGWALVLDDILERSPTVLIVCSMAPTMTTPAQIAKTAPHHTEGHGLRSQPPPHSPSWIGGHLPQAVRR